MVVHSWPKTSKMHDSSHSKRMADEIERLSPIKPRKQIGRKHRFGYPGRPAAGVAPKSNARIDDLNPGGFSQVGSSNVLTTALRTDTKPGWMGFLSRDHGQR